jgi:hypothetical protein
MTATKTIDDRIRVYDNGGKTFDRYTVAYLETAFISRATGKKEYEFVGMSAYPFHPQGFGQHGECGIGRHLGKRIKFADLPEQCQRLVLSDLRSIDSE